MKLTNRTCLLMCLCAASFVWQSDASMAQQPSAQQYEPIEIIPFRNSGRNTPFRVPLAQAPFQEGSGGRNFDPRTEAFGPREAQEYRRPYRANYQEAIGPDADRPQERQFRQHAYGSQPGGSGSRGGHGGCRKCQGHHGPRPNGSPDQRRHDRRPHGERQFEQRQFDVQPYDDRQYNEGADVVPSLTPISSRYSDRPWRPNPFAAGR